MVCRKCGAEMQKEDIFCQMCGAKNEPVVEDNSADVMPTVADDRNITISGPVIDDIKVYNDMLRQVWPDWTIVNKLGEGSFGKVYKAERNEMGSVFNSAIKIITIPQNDSEIETIRAEAGLDEQSTSSFFKALVDDCVNEIKMMESFKGTQNIVSVEDYKVVPHKDKVGWTIFIRMELLTSFIAYTKNKVMTEKDVIKLGIDICSALECCAKLNVMHRDIKPENIFVSPFGDYKLGDFGIARKLEKTTSGMSRKGTYNYMAPEIYGGNGQYDCKSDIYSLGIVLYKLLNNNRFPLVDARSNAVTYQQMQEAFDKRMAGASLPKPMTASNALANVILVACSFDPEERFSSASALKAALLNVQSGKADKAFEGGTVSLPPVSGNKKTSVKEASPVKRTEAVKEKAPKVRKEKKKMSKGKKAGIITVFVLSVLLVAGVTGAILYFTSPDYRIRKEYKAGNYDAAVEIYNTEAQEPSKTLVGFFDNRLDELRTAFIVKASDYATVEKELDAIEKFKISAIEEKAAEVRGYSGYLNKARNAYTEAEGFMAEADYVSAMAKYDEVIGMAEEKDGISLDISHFDYDAAVTKKAQAIESFRQAELDKAAGNKANGEFAIAFEILEKALEVLPGDSILSETLAEYKREEEARTKQEHLDKAKLYAENENYERALRELKSALEKFPDDAEIKAKMEEYQKQYEEKITNEVFESVDKAIEDNDYVEAVNVLKKAVDDYPDIKEIYVRYNTVVREYKKDIFSEVDNLVSNRETSEALSVLDGAIALLPEDKELIEKKKEIEGKQPVALSTMKAFQKDEWEWNEGVAKDPFGNTYEHYDFKIFEIYDERTTKHETEYLVSGKYNTITGSIVPYESIPENATAVVKVFAQTDAEADFTLAYSSDEIKRKTEVFDFVADITGAKYITVVVEISFAEDEENPESADALLLMDVQLWP